MGEDFGILTSRYRTKNSSMTTLFQAGILWAIYPVRTSPYQRGSHMGHRMHRFVIKLSAYQAACDAILVNSTVVSRISKRFVMKCMENDRYHNSILISLGMRGVARLVRWRVERFICLRRSGACSGGRRSWYWPRLFTCKGNMCSTNAATHRVPLTKA